jgi:hypothetical protein
MMKKKGAAKKKMNMGGMMSPTKKKPTGSATGLTGMKGGGMMKKKGYAKGGMKKKGYAMGGAMKKPTANQKGLKNRYDSIVESIIISEDSGNADTITVTITDAASAVFNLFKVKAISANGTVELLSRDLLLTAGDILKVQAATANRLHVVASITEIPS